MTKEGYIIKPMQLSNVVDGMRLSTEAGWNQTEKDWKFLLEHRENICLVAVHGDKIIGTTTAINYSGKIAWLGMVLVDKALRGQGVSKMLLSGVLERLPAFRSIKLDATPEGQPVYKKFGFHDECLIVRMTTVVMQPMPLPKVDNKLPERLDLNDVEEIIALDEHVFGGSRTQLIKSLVKEHPQKARVFKEDNRITGFALGRSGNKYQHIGPVVASGIADAKILIADAMNNLSGQAIVVDVIADKKELLEWLSSNGFTKQRQFMRMYKHENCFPGVNNKQYLICGPEFG